MLLLFPKDMHFIVLQRLQRLHANQLASVCLVLPLFASRGASNVPRT